ncbi:hypothetical protein KBD61_02290 [Patescibacteria group bacterium]|nr:hypothetical protein [Patescibacteria group bacterium]MBP9709838.1 hypothetical protein [Patescibacteria group bacterium]
MKPSKILKDWLFKAYLGKKTVPAGLVELHKYFQNYGPINFEKHKEDGAIIAVSQNFRFGSIITQGVNEKELDRNIRDAILTAFEVPSSYAQEAGIKRQRAEAAVYATA